MESVSTYVPATSATPSTIASAVRAARSRRDGQPLERHPESSSASRPGPSWRRRSASSPERCMSLTIRPSARNRIRSAMEAARGSWVTITTVWPTVSTERRSSARISCPEAESRLPVGSSANSTVGRLISARAIATRCCWPPESSAGRWVSRSRRPVSSMTVLEPGRVGLAAGDGQRQEHVLPRRQHRQQVEELKDEADVVAAQPGELRRRHAGDLRPSIVTDPSVGLSSPARMCMSVDLPEPDGPMTAVSRPRSMSTDTSRSAVTAVSPSPYRRVSPDAPITVTCLPAPISTPRRYRNRRGDDP